MADDLDRVVNETGMGRRTFVRRLVTGAVFATPVVASFAMGGVEAASAAPRGNSPLSIFPLCNANQTELKPVSIANANQNESFEFKVIDSFINSVCSPNQSSFGHLSP